MKAVLSHHIHASKNANKNVEYAETLGICINKGKSKIEVHKRHKNYISLGKENTFLKLT